MRSENLYCERLGIEPPRVFDLLARYRLNLREAMILALLEHGGPMTIEELIDRIELVWDGRGCGNLAAALPRSWGGRQPVYRDKRGRYGLNLHSRELRQFLHQLRILPNLVDSPYHAPHSMSSLSDWRREREVEAALFRRGILHCLPGPEEPAVYGLLNPGVREIQIGTAEEAREAVRGLDVVAGLDVRETLHALGLEPDRFILRDLRPPQKTKRLRGGGPRIRLTPTLLIRSTTEIEEPLSDPARARADAAAGRLRDLRRQVEADLKSLFALYRFGVLHGAVLIRFEGDLDLVRVDWAEPGDVSYDGQVRAAARGKRPFEAVIGKAPDWDDPWKLARRVRPEAMGAGSGHIFDWETEEHIYPVYVQAVRLR